MEDTGSLLNKFDSIDLKELDQVKLMNRKDIKFTFSVDQLPDLLRDMQLHYRCLEVKEKRISNYKTLYLDTSDLGLYKQHHNGNGRQNEKLLHVATAIGFSNFTPHVFCHAGQTFLATHQAVELVERLHAGE